MKLFLTGQPHVGKSTALISALNNITNKQGFTAGEVKENGHRTGFKLVAANGKEATLAHINIKTPYQVSRYFVDVEALDKFIQPLFKFNPKELLYIDEIGQMELFSNEFKRLVEIYLKADNAFVGTMTSVYRDEFVYSIKSQKNVILVNLSIENRDEVQKVLQYFVESLNKFLSLSKNQQIAVERLTKSYFEKSQYTQLVKLFKNTAYYLADNKVQELNKNTFLVEGNTGKHQVFNNNGNWTCDCDLFNGKGNFVNNPGECSHIQVSKILSNDL